MATGMRGIFTASDLISDSGVFSSNKIDLQAKMDRKNFDKLSAQEQLNHITAGGNVPTGVVGNFGKMMQGSTNTRKTGQLLEKLGFKNFVKGIEEIAFLDTDPEAAKKRKISLRDLRRDPITKNNILKNEG